MNLEWINPEDKLPPEGERVLCIGRNGGYQICRFIHDTFWARQTPMNVYYWMPLPADPRGAL